MLVSANSFFFSIGCEVTHIHTHTHTHTHRSCFVYHLNKF